ncbi:MAG: hypothetical protein WC243_03440 [Patescibacteria group bacterium]|jgi:hypothetical protein
MFLEEKLDKKYGVFLIAFEDAFSLKSGFGIFLLKNMRGLDKPSIFEIREE